MKDYKLSSILVMPLPGALANIESPGYIVLLARSGQGLYTFITSTILTYTIHTYTIHTYTIHTYTIYRYAHTPDTN